MKTVTEDEVKQAFKGMFPSLNLEKSIFLERIPCVDDSSCPLSSGIILSSTHPIILTTYGELPMMFFQYIDEEYNRQKNLDNPTKSGIMIFFESVAYVGVDFLYLNIRFEKCKKCQSLHQTSENYPNYLNEEIIKKFDTILSKI